MGKIRNLKLVELNKVELSKRELNKVAGGTPGECCICAHGAANHYANEEGGLYSGSLMGTYTKVR